MTHPISREDCDRILNTPGCDPATSNSVRVARLKHQQHLADMVPVAYTQLLVPPAEYGWSLHNPCILAVGSGFYCIVRSSNYTIGSDRASYRPIDAGQVIRTENIFVWLDSQLRIQHSELIAGPDYAKRGMVQGFEDCRLFPTRDGFAASATVCGTSVDYVQMGVARLLLNPARFDQLFILEADTNRHEKNWMPVIGRGEWIYKINKGGYTCCVVPQTKMEFKIVRGHAAPPIARDWSGGTQLTPYAGGWLCMAHEKSFNPGMCYEHRFVWFNSTLRLCRWSDTFVFHRKTGIEFAAGITAVADNVYVSFGVNDATAWIAKLSVESVEKLLVRGG